MTEPKTDEKELPFKGCPEDHWRIRLLVSYDGTDYFGWQRQSRHVSVQSTLEDAIARIFSKHIPVLGASRTDTGVHAIGQVAHFDSPKDPASFRDLRYSIQNLTPPSLVVRDIWEAPRDFHAIASSVKKTYRYVVLNRRVPSALRHRYSWWVRYPLNVEYLNAASRFLMGEHDFKSFQTTGTTVKSTVRTVHSVQWEQIRSDTLVFKVTGNGFLKQMVRNIVGTLVTLNQEQAPPEKMAEILNAQDRRLAGVTAPPQGLYLSRVYYPETLDKKCRKL